MKNILLATTGLFGAALLATAASAAGPKVTVGGFADFQAGYTSDDFDTNARHQAFRNDTEISVRVDGKTDSGLGYGAVIDLEADVTEDANNQGTNAARTFTYLDGSWGKVELGSNKGAAATQRVDASTLASATGGINGAWNHQVNGAAAGLVAAGGFITGSKLVSEHGSITGSGLAGSGSVTDESTYNSNKITYYSPRFSGFQIGASYTPKLAARGQTINRADNDGVFGDVIEAGVNFEHQFDGGIKLAASATGEIGDADSALAGAEDLEAFAIGALVGYQGFSAAASYGDWGDIAAGTDADYWSAGLGYDGGIYSVSATYLDSTVDAGAAENEFNNLVIGADYKLAPGITPYAEVSFYDFDSANGTYDNEGTAVILGTQVAF